MTPEQQQTVMNLAMKLTALRINCKFSHLESGPIVTTYYLHLGADVPIAKILKSEEDMALAVGAPSVLITRKGAQIAIAIPNKEKSLVSYDQCLHSIMQDTKQMLPVMLGVDVRGTERSIDLVESPHILIAGSTGAGKSVLLASIISSLAIYKSKAEL